MLRLAQSSCSRTPILSWPLHLNLPVSVASPWLCGMVSICVSLSFWLETTETTLLCPPYTHCYTGPLSSPEICWMNSRGISKNSCTAHLRGEKQKAVSSSEFRPAPNPSHSPARKKAIIPNHCSLIVWSGAQHHLRVTHSLHWEQ